MGQQATYIGEIINKDQAAFIVRAVNAHDDLLRLAKDYLELVRSLDQAREIGDDDGGVEKDIKAAIAKAEGLPPASRPTPGTPSGAGTL